MNKYSDLLEDDGLLDYRFDYSGGKFTATVSFDTEEAFIEFLRSKGVSLAEASDIVDTFRQEEIMTKLIHSPDDIEKQSCITKVSKELVKIVSNITVSVIIDGDKIKSSPHIQALKVEDIDISEKINQANDYVKSFVNDKITDAVANMEFSEDVRSISSQLTSVNIDWSKFFTPITTEEKK